MNSVVKTFEELIVEAASFVLAVDEFTPLHGEKNEVVLAGLQIDRDRACLNLIEHVSNNPLLRILILGAEADRIKNGPDLSTMSKDDILKSLFNPLPEK